MDFTFQTKLIFPEYPHKIDTSSSIFLTGSCFTENIGKRLADCKFSTNINLFGILYNPLSIENSLQRIIKKKYYKEDELVQTGDSWCSMDHHSCFSDNDPDSVLSSINKIIVNTHSFLLSCDFVFVSLGTAFCYKYIMTERVVSNCHKLPQSMFKKELISVEMCKNSLKNIINNIQSHNTKCTIFFTLSPVKHLRDGLIENNVSKSILRSAVYEVEKEHNNVYYFPSYEILNDELRDYRFFKEDMAHPSEQTVNYIWCHFKDHCFSKETKEMCTRIEKINRGLTHTPFNIHSSDYKAFAKLLIIEMESLEKQYSHIDWSSEKEKLGKIV